MAGGSLKDAISGHDVYWGSVLARGVCWTQCSGTWRVLDTVFWDMNILDTVIWEIKHTRHNIKCCV